MFFLCKYVYDKTIEREILKLLVFVKLAGRFLALRKDDFPAQSWPGDMKTTDHFSL